MSWGGYFIFIGGVGAFFTGAIIVIVAYRKLMDRPLSWKKEAGVAAMLFTATAVVVLIVKLVKLIF